MDYRHPLSPIVTALERGFGWAAFPSPIRILVIFQVVATLLARAVPGYGDLLLLDKARILEHYEVWRLLTFLFVTDTPMLFVIFLLFIMWMINDGMESEWGAFRVDLYLFGTWLGMVVAAWILPVGLQQQFLGIETMVLYSSLFMAFATLHPKNEILVFFVLPVQVRWLAVINAVVLLRFVLSAFLLPDPAFRIGGAARDSWDVTLPARLRSIVLPLPGASKPNRGPPVSLQSEATRFRPGLSRLRQVRHHRSGSP